MAQSTTIQGVGESLFGLIKKIDNAANIFIGEVVSVDIPSRTCSVKSITGIGNDGVNDNTSDENLKKYINYINSPMIHESVALMSGGNIDDGFLLIPTIGSQVTCMDTKTQQAFIVQYTSIDNAHINPKGSYEIKVNSNTILVAEQSIDLKVNNGAELVVDTKFDIKSANGANINADTKITIKNNSDSLVSILTDLMTAIETITVTCAAPGAPSTPPLNLSQFTLINTRIQNLLQ